MSDAASTIPLPAPRAHASGLGVLLAFLCVYVVWGSTYLAILYTLETMPPFLMAAARFLSAGSILYLYCRSRGIPKPTGKQWRDAVIVGGLLLLGGNGAVVWAELHISSGLAALLVSTVPIWMVLLDWIRPGGNRPASRVFYSLALGFVGVSFLLGPTDFSTPEVSPSGETSWGHLGGLVVLVGALCWATGSIFSRNVAQPQSALLVTAMRMLGGGGLLVLVATVTGEWSDLSISAISMKSWLALLYLVFFGSILAFSCYVWLLRVSTPARVGTYAYVNPVVAVFLGWVGAGEEITPRILFGSALIVGSVMLITSRSPAPRSSSKSESAT